MKTLNYDRPVARLVDDTPIDLRIKVAEGNNALAVISPDGTTARLDYVLQGDADPGGALDWTDLFTVTLTPSILNGIMQLTYVITPKNGDGTLGVAITDTVPHSQSLDNWQSSAGQPRLEAGDFVIELIKTADYTLVSDDNFKIFATIGASGTVIFTLPAAVALPSNGRPYRVRFRVGAAQTLRVLAVGTDVISQGAMVGSAGGNVESNVVGAQIELLNDKAGNWVAAPLGPTLWSLT